MIYSYVKADGRIIPMEVDTPFRLEEMQKLVGGFIEFTPGPDGTELCINEEGRINGMERNARYPHVFGDVIVGRSVPGPDGREFVGIL